LIEGDADLDKTVVQQVHLHHIRHQGFLQKGLEVFHLEPVLVGNSEVTDLPRKVEFPESLGDFLPLPKGVGPVQQEAVQPVSAQAPQDRVDAFQDVFAAAYNVLMDVEDVSATLKRSDA
jgi:hypothetical protein